MSLAFFRLYLLICRHRHRWMHKIADEPPNVEPVPRPKYLSPHTENLTGTRKAFKTYSTTAPKILAWEPKVNRRK